MSKKVKDINIKNRTYYFFNDIIDKENFYPNNIIIDEKSYKNILNLPYWIRDNQRIRKNLQCKSFVPYFRYVNGYFEKINANKYLTLVPTDENKEKIKKYEELWIKIRDLIRSITKNSDTYDYDEK